MELTGKIIQIMPLQSGNGKNGVWKKQDYILETNAQYPKKVCLTVWGDNIDSFGLQSGEQVTVSIDVESREYNGKWYTDVKAWKVQKDGAATTSTPASAKSTVPDVTSFSDDSADDVLPF
ncbi:DUF3127 domain-containing protein [Mongoliitalea daihaiensis]|uniref:DUF3127 domain-containing protein n=1 Tax=Mongoliitalea daihaiensis TaxID=2782006 RepID=UPI001F2823B4|nr:DUF3127 domain-containing protein [Mongoliitalea daihaiensis]UJP65981.1 DUF3127 domain-containing protein [Mongoliitalea daihaiensis]